MRPSIEALKKHKLFTQDKPADYWIKIAAKNAQEVPYKPDPLKHANLLQNEYPLVSNLTRKSSNMQVGTGRVETPSQAMQDAALLNEASEETACAGGTPTFGGRDHANVSALSANQFKKGDPIGKKGSRPTNMERE